MEYTDGYIAFHAELMRQLAYAPDAPETEDADGFFEAYHGYKRYADILEDVEAEAKMLFEACQAGDIEDDYASLDEVPRDDIVRVRIFANGDLQAYPCALMAPGETPAQIGPDEFPMLSLPRAQIYGDFGLDDPCLDQEDNAPGGLDI